MSLRTKILGLVEILLRVPPLFVIDEILKIGLGLTEITEYDLSEFEEKLDDNAFNFSSGSVPYDPTFYRFILISLVRLVLSTVGKLFCLSS